MIQYNNYGTVNINVSGSGLQALPPAIEPLQAASYDLPLPRAIGASLQRLSPQALEPRVAFCAQGIEIFFLRLAPSEQEIIRCLKPYADQHFSTKDTFYIPFYLAPLFFDQVLSDDADKLTEYKEGIKAYYRAYFPGVELPSVPNLFYEKAKINQNAKTHFLNMFTPEEKNVLALQWYVENGFITLQEILIKGSNTLLTYLVPSQEHKEAFLERIQRITPLQKLDFLASYLANSYYPVRPFFCTAGITYYGEIFVKKTLSSVLKTDHMRFIKLAQGGLLVEQSLENLLLYNLGQSMLVQMRCDGLVISTPATSASKHLFSQLAEQGLVDSLSDNHVVIGVRNIERFFKECQIAHPEYDLLYELIQNGRYLGPEEKTQLLLKSGYQVIQSSQLGLTTRGDEEGNAALNSEIEDCLAFQIAPTALLMTKTLTSQGLILQIPEPLYIEIYQSLINKGIEVDSIQSLNHALPSDDKLPILIPLEQIRKLNSLDNRLLAERYILGQILYGSTPFSSKEQYRMMSKIGVHLQNNTMWVKTQNLG